MLVCTFDMVGTSSLAWGAPVMDEERLDNETLQDRENRVWRKKFHSKADGRLIVPAMAVKIALSEYAKYKAEPIKGKGKATYTKHFEAGILIPEDAELVESSSGEALTVEDLKPVDLFVPSDGRKGGGKRVWRRFPYLEEGSWKARVSVYVIDVDVLTEAKIEEYAKGAGVLIGVGFFRPRNGGTRGRWRVDGFVGEKQDI